MTYWFRNNHKGFNMLSDDSSLSWTGTPPSSSSHIFSLGFGTGNSIYRNSILPAITSAEHEVILVTCFWARSSTLDALNAALKELSVKGVRRQSRIRVRINFSSSSLFQKLFHTTSLNGRTYSPHEWQSKLGLPNASELAGLELEVKSIFVLPFSVMHPKFIIIDRSVVFLPSCNVSWENWFEGCVQLNGPITEQFLDFWRSFWASDVDQELSVPHHENDAENRTLLQLDPVLLSAQALQMRDVESIFLPSPHHRNPQFALPWRPCPSPPETPLNRFILTAFANAKSSIYIQTPNLTSPPVLFALLAALRRGVDVMITTSERLMILEQLLTAGTTTQRCVGEMMRSHQQIIKQWRDSSSSVSLEAGRNVTPGVLNVRLYRSDPSASQDRSEPVQSHLKLNIVDDRITILGSGNMDRASWFTSQELGVAFLNEDFAIMTKNVVEDLMRHRTRPA